MIERGPRFDEDLAAALNGVTTAANRLAQGLGPKIEAFAWRMLMDRAEAQDVAQETLMRLWRDGRAILDQSRPVAPWAFRVAANLCHDRLRRRPTVGLEWAQEVSDDAPDPQAALMQSDDARAVQAALAALPERQRLAIVLCHYEGWPQADAAALMEISLDAYESLLSRARSRLRTMLADKLGKKE